MTDDVRTNGTEKTMARPDEAREILADLLQMISSDLMKASHYLKKAVAIAVVAQDDEKAHRLAGYLVELEDFSNRFEKE